MIDKENSDSPIELGTGAARPSLRPALAGSLGQKAFLRVPPFPGAKIQRLAAVHWANAAVDVSDLAEAVLRLRVGGTYWGAQPELPAGHILVRSSAARGSTAREFANGPIVLWEEKAASLHSGPGLTVVRHECDPWHMLSSASAVVVEPGDELRVIAALLRVPCYIFDADNGSLELCRAEAGNMLAKTLSASLFENPFTGEVMNARQAVELCGFWRGLVDSNRDLAAGIGFAFWKQAHVAPLLWGGSGDFTFLRAPREVPSGARIAIWRAKAAPDALLALERRNIEAVEVEDGFLRSRGLGADCIPPLSITADRLGAHFDPSQPSELEQLLEHGLFDEPLLDRARDLRELIVEAGLGKYERSAAVLDRPAGDRCHLLVPGQVEDDRAVQAGGCGLVSNLELLRRVREQAPDAYILYKPHPDVLAGHRRGAISERQCLQFADEIVSDSPIASLIAIADEVHVNTSLAGFEALLRGKAVTTYGVPFYAGWGLTHDFGPVPKRRTARRSIDELVAATLLLYPRYLDPVTGLPCPAEVVVQRLSTEASSGTGVIVGMRRFQGRLMRRLRSLVQ